MPSKLLLDERERVLSYECLCRIVAMARDAEDERTLMIETAKKGGPRPMAVTHWNLVTLKRAV